MRTLKDLDVKGQRVLVRVDFNVPLTGTDPVTITDDARIRGALPTLEYLLAHGASLVLAAHLGRPEGPDPALSLAPVAERLSDLLGRPVALAPEVVGEQAAAMAAALAPGDVMMLENVRFEPGETKNDPALAQAYADLADLYVNDAFGTAHRAHASTEGVAHLLPSAAGLLMAGEVHTLTGILKDPARPLVAIVGGAKVTDKIGVIDAFLDRADVILIGGAMCFPFFKAQGHSVGDSLCEEAGVEPARRALADAEKKDCRLLLPIDLVTADSFSPDATVRPLRGVDVHDGWMGLDIGPITATAYVERIMSAGTVFWNGPMGAFEMEAFASGTKAVAQAMADTDAVTVVGGGDSAAAMAKYRLTDRVNHMSTGGGASLELIEGSVLPGVHVLGAL